MTDTTGMAAEDPNEDYPSPKKSGKKKMKKKKGFKADMVAPEDAEDQMDGGADEAEEGPEGGEPSFAKPKKAKKKKKGYSSQDDKINRYKNIGFKPG